MSPELDVISKPVCYAPDQQLGQYRPNYTPSSDAALHFNILPSLLVKSYNGLPKRLPSDELDGHRLRP